MIINKIVDWFQKEDFEAARYGILFAVMAFLIIPFVALVATLNPFWFLEKSEGPAIARGASAMLAIIGGIFGTAIGSDLLIKLKSKTRISMYERKKYRRRV